jgi:hypothetical protein
MKDKVEMMIDVFLVGFAMAAGWFGCGILLEALFG